MAQFDGRFFLSDPFGEILFQIRQLVQSELPQTPSLQHELISFAPASLLRHNITGDVFSPKAWTVQIPMLVVQFGKDDIENGRTSPRFTSHGTPLLALLWSHSVENSYLITLLNSFSIPWLLVDRDRPITWSTKEVRDRLYTLRNHAKTAPLISSPQFFVAKQLAELEKTNSLLENINKSASEPSTALFGRVVVQQEVSMSSVIGFEGHHSPPILNRGSFDFVLFSDILSGKGADRIRGAKWLPILAIEYDGKSNHATAQQRQSDQRKNEICRLAGLPLLRVSYKHLQSTSPPTKESLMRHEQELNSRILASTFFHSLEFPRTKHRREQMLRRIYDSTIQKTSDSGEAIRSVYHWIEEISNDEHVDHLMIEHQLGLLVGKNILIDFEQDTDGLFYGIVKDRDSGRKRWRSPSLSLDLHGAEIDGYKLARKILLDWIWDEQLKAHDINPDEGPMRA